MALYGPIRVQKARSPHGQSAQAANRDCTSFASKFFRPPTNIRRGTVLDNPSLGTRATYNLAYTKSTQDLTERRIMLRAGRYTVCQPRYPSFVVTQYSGGSRHVACHTSQGNMQLARRPNAKKSFPPGHVRIRIGPAKGCGGAPKAGAVLNMYKQMRRHPAPVTSSSRYSRSGPRPHLLDFSHLRAQFEVL